MLNAIEAAQRRLGATPADIPGLWRAPGYPELTAGQLLAAAEQLDRQCVGVREIAQSLLGNDLAQ